MADKPMPGRIYISTDRQWAKSETPICTVKYVRADLPAGLVEQAKRAVSMLEHEIIPYLRGKHDGHGPGAAACQDAEDIASALRRALQAREPTPHTPEERDGD